MDQALLYAALVATCFLVPGLALSHGSTLLTGDRGVLVRLRERLERRDEDLVALTVWAFHRSQQLGAHLERLTRLLASDASMSATRQLGNRLAYRQVVADLSAVPDLPDPDDSCWSEREWLLLERDLGTQPVLQTMPGRPDVELLDVGWAWR